MRPSDATVAIEFDAEVHVIGADAITAPPASFAVA
jgi:hypothetical protein